MDPILFNLVLTVMEGQENQRNITKVFALSPGIF